MNCKRIAKVCIGMLCVSPMLFGTHPSLKKTFEHDFLIGSAVNSNHFHENDFQTVEIIKAQFNSVTSENVLKWESVHPLPHEYSFEGPDQFIQFGQKHKMFIVGHTLVWHRQTPSWVFEDGEGNPIDRNALLERLQSHICSVMGRYKNRIHGWDVVNEALDPDGSLRQSPWIQILGKDYVVKAFQLAHEADPSAQLYYNDYGLEDPIKREGAIALIRAIQESGVPIAAIGLQAHYTLDWPSIQQIEETIADFAALGIKVNFTELDIDVLPSAWEYEAVNLSPEMHARLNPYPLALPASIDHALAKRYTELFQVYLKYQHCIERVTFWGVSDRESWLNVIPIKGRTNYPLLFDRKGQPKQALDAIISLKS